MLIFLLPSNNKSRIECNIYSPPALFQAVTSMEMAWATPTFVPDHAMILWQAPQFRIELLLPPTLIPNSDKTLQKWHISPIFLWCISQDACSSLWRNTVCTTSRFNIWLQRTICVMILIQTSRYRNCDRMCWLRSIHNSSWSRDSHNFRTIQWTCLMSQAPCPEWRKKWTVNTKRLLRPTKWSYLLNRRPSQCLACTFRPKKTGSNLAKSSFLR